jgi:hypothetical protein
VIEVTATLARKAKGREIDPSITNNLPGSSKVVGDFCRIHLFVVQVSHIYLREAF